MPVAHCAATQAIAVDARLRLISMPATYEDRGISEAAAHVEQKHILLRRLA